MPQGQHCFKGGPGTGKSTIALYRVRSLIHEFRKQGQEKFGILFTTYTNALVNSSEQLLQQLLGDDCQYVQVQTADKIVKQVIAEAKAPRKLIENSELADLLQQAIKETQFNGTVAQKLAQKQAIEKLSFNYLQQEINQVIVARQLQMLEEYLSAPRPGRRMALSKLWRQAVWEVHETLQRLLAQEGKETWHQFRARARKVCSPRTNQSQVRCCDH